ncbi:type I restriction-modification system DNA methylase subunit [Mucilaginibacter yixingensis]|uniref:site-specific DNA-methyltransferase (adenine-specific) n=1 Tax=Mucilaginibacter yixingensis TaxID=1295612 RepID=A0A2T5JBQ5_9SPHI|nr:N-6 DNA methylase [Mucilaginibacter yixingensis]PTQ99194.1 type I restriction-modification system DNA methylase subunit [Mucilaginibacter yixingensis]
MVQNTDFRRYLTSLSYSEEEIAAGLLDETTFSYTVDTEGRLTVKYIFTPTANDIYLEHRSLWNMNRDNVFIAVTDQQSHIINVKEKPDAARPLKNAICLRTFEYGVNSLGFEEIVPSEISKQYIDSAFFFDFVAKNQRKGQEVDKDLLLNLLQLKSDLISDSNEEMIHLLILRCIFIKYLEDRGIFETDYLINILKSLDAKQLVAAFNEIKKINGDVFKYDSFKVTDIKQEYLKQLALFFETDYRSGQHFLFPYQFDRIPIQLISHVYEAFLKDNSKKRKGIYYTPSFLVDFMLNQLFNGEDNIPLADARCLDAAVGSGAFLVECFKRIQASFGRPLSFDEKKKILETQLFGIDIDQKALQITAFSLYLALLETEDPNFIKNEIIHAHPILPSLIGSTLMSANAITDEVFKGQTFDYIISNPPWGSVPKVEDAQDEQEINNILKERKAIANKGKGDGIYAHVADFERSQAFLVRFQEWAGASTRIAAVVKNSIFLNDNARDFRSYLLDTYALEKFFELSHYNKILFKKKNIGEIKGQAVELGASEPCAVVILKQLPANASEISTTYISPKLSIFAENFSVIHFTARDCFQIAQSNLKNQDAYWKILVNGDLDTFKVIEKLSLQCDLTVEARAGFQPKANMLSLGEPDWKPIAEPTDFKQFDVLKADNLPVFNWNQGLHRRREFDIFQGIRLVIPVRPLKSDKFLFRGAIAYDDIIYKHNMITIKLKDGKDYISDYLPYLAIINSKLIGFLFYQLSIQWGKGEGKRDSIRNVDLEKLPLKRISDPTLAKQLSNLVSKIQIAIRGGQNPIIEIDELDELVFEHYGLLDYERQVIKEFYQMNVDRADAPLNKVTASDLNVYFNAFVKAFQLVLAEGTVLSATYNISGNMGALICMRLSQQNEAEPFRQGEDKHIINFVKSGQLNKAEALKILEEEKVKIYDKEHIYLIKSNQFKDWTPRQAVVDAREEIQQYIKHLA